MEEAMAVEATLAGAWQEQGVEEKEQKEVAAKGEFKPLKKPYR